MSGLEFAAFWGWGTRDALGNLVGERSLRTVGIRCHKACLCLVVCTWPSPQASCGSEVSGKTGW